MRKLEILILDDLYADAEPDYDAIRKWYKRCFPMDNVTLAQLAEAYETLERVEKELGQLSLRLGTETEEWRQLQLAKGFVVLARLYLPIKAP